MAQYNENEMVLKEFKMLDENSTVFKLVGPVHLGQDLDETKTTVENVFKHRRRNVSALCHPHQPPLISKRPKERQPSHAPPPIQFRGISPSQDVKDYARGKDADVPDIFQEAEHNFSSLFHKAPIMLNDFSDSIESLRVANTKLVGPSQQPMIQQHQTATSRAHVQRFVAPPHQDKYLYVSEGGGATYLQQPAIRRAHVEGYVPPPPYVAPPFKKSHQHLVRPISDAVVRHVDEKSDIFTRVMLEAPAAIGTLTHVKTEAGSRSSVPAYYSPTRRRQNAASPMGPALNLREVVSTKDLDVPALLTTKNLDVPALNFLDASADWVDRLQAPPRASRPPPTKSRTSLANVRVKAYPQEEQQKQEEQHWWMDPFGATSHFSNPVATTHRAPPPQQSSPRWNGQPDQMRVVLADGSKRDQDLFEVTAGLLDSIPTRIPRTPTRSQRVQDLNSSEAQAGGVVGAGNVRILSDSEIEALSQKLPGQWQANGQVQEERAVEMNVRLNMDFSAAGPAGSAERRVFIQDLKQDLADAAGVATSDFNVRNVSPGSVLVAVNAPEKQAQEIQRQSLDPNSKLRSGKVTRFTEAITLGPPVPHPLAAHPLRLQNAPYQMAEGVVGREQGVFGTSAYGAVLDKALHLGREGGDGVSAQEAQDHGKQPSSASDFPQLFPAHLWAPAGQVAGQVHKRQKGPDHTGPSATAMPSMPRPPIKQNELDKRGDSNHTDPKNTRAFSPPPSSAQAAATRPAFGPEALLPVLDNLFKEPPRQAPAGQVRKVMEGRHRQEEREQQEQVTGPRASAATQGGGAAGAAPGDGIAGMRLHVEVLQADLDKLWASGSVERREFSDGVVKDLSVGGGMPAHCFRLVNVMRGGPLMREPTYTSTSSSTSSVLEEVIVDVEVHGDASSDGRSEARSPLAAALNLQTQVSDANSLLRKGNWTRRCRAIHVFEVKKKAAESNPGGDGHNVAQTITTPQRQEAERLELEVNVQAANVGLPSGQSLFLCVSLLGESSSGQRDSKQPHFSHCISEPQFMSKDKLCGKGLTGVNEKLFFTHFIKGSVTASPTQTQKQKPEFRNPETYKVKTLFAYQAREKDEITFSQGEELDVFPVPVEEGWYKGMTSDKRTGLVPSTYIDLTALTAQERQAPQDLAPGGDAPSIGLNFVCVPGHTPQIEHVHVGSPAHNAGLLEGDRILSVSATNVRTRTDVKGVSSDQLIVLLKQTFHAATLAGGRMIVEVERFGAVLFVELRPLLPPPAQEMHAAFGHSRNEYEFMALTREHLAREAVELLVSIHASSNRTDARSGMLGQALLRAPFGSEMHKQEVSLLDADGRQVMLPDGQSARVVLSYRYIAEAAAAHGGAAAPAKSVEMNVRLNMDFSAAGPAGSAERRVFIQDLKQDLADAAGVATSDFNVRNVSPGSVLVAVNAPEKPAQEIQRQSLDPNSKLRSGKVTRFTEAITLGPSKPVGSEPRPHEQLSHVAAAAADMRPLPRQVEGGGWAGSPSAVPAAPPPDSGGFAAHLWAPAGQVRKVTEGRQRQEEREQREQVTGPRASAATQGGGAAGAAPTGVNPPPANLAELKAAPYNVAHPDWPPGVPDGRDLWDELWAPAGHVNAGAGQGKQPASPVKPIPQPETSKAERSAAETGVKRCAPGPQLDRSPPQVATLESNERALVQCRVHRVEGVSGAADFTDGQYVKVIQLVGATEAREFKTHVKKTVHVAEETIGGGVCHFDEVFTFVCDSRDNMIKIQVLQKAVKRAYAFPSDKYAVEDDLMGEAVVDVGKQVMWASIEAAEPTAVQLYKVASEFSNDIGPEQKYAVADKVFVSFSRCNEAHGMVLKRDMRLPRAAYRMTVKERAVKGLKALARQKFVVILVGVGDKKYAEEVHEKLWELGIVDRLSEPRGLDCFTDNVFFVEHSSQIKDLCKRMGGVMGVIDHSFSTLRSIEPEHVEQGCRCVLLQPNSSDRASAHEQRLLQDTCEAVLSDKVQMLSQAVTRLRMLEQELFLKHNLKVDDPSFSRDLSRAENDEARSLVSQLNQIEASVAELRRDAEAASRLTPVPILCCPRSRSDMLIGRIGATDPWAQTCEVFGVDAAAVELESAKCIPLSLSQPLGDNPPFYPLSDTVHNYRSHRWELLCTRGKPIQNVLGDVGITPTNGLPHASDARFGAGMWIDAIDYASSAFSSNMLRKGDRIISVDGIFVNNMTTSEVKRLLSGAAGSSVTLGAACAHAPDQVFYVRLTRKCLPPATKTGKGRLIVMIDDILLAEAGVSPADKSDSSVLRVSLDGVRNLPAAFGSCKVRGRLNVRTLSPQGELLRIQDSVQLRTLSDEQLIADQHYITQPAMVRTAEGSRDLRVIFEDRPFDLHVVDPTKDIEVVIFMEDIRFPPEKIGLKYEQMVIGRAILSPQQLVQASEEGEAQQWWGLKHELGYAISSEVKVTARLLSTKDAALKDGVGERRAASKLSSAFAETIGMALTIDDTYIIHDKYIENMVLWAKEEVERNEDQIKQMNFHKDTFYKELSLDLAAVLSTSEDRFEVCNVFIPSNMRKNLQALPPFSYKVVLTRGAGGGIGLNLSADRGRSPFVVDSLMPGSPIAICGQVSPGHDVLYSVDGVRVQDKSLDQVIEMIKGPAGTQVTLVCEAKISHLTTSLLGAEPIKAKPQQQIVAWVNIVPDPAGVDLRAPRDLFTEMMDQMLCGDTTPLLRQAIRTKGIRDIQIQSAFILPPTRKSVPKKALITTDTDDVDTTRALKLKSVLALGKKRAQDPALLKVPAVVSFYFGKKVNEEKVRRDAALCLGLPPGMFEIGRFDSTHVDLCIYPENHMAQAHKQEIVPEWEAQRRSLGMGVQHILASRLVAEVLEKDQTQTQNLLVDGNLVSQVAVQSVIMDTAVLKHAKEAHCLEEPYLEDLQDWMRSWPETGRVVACMIGPQWDEAVPFTLTLDMDLNSMGDEEAFKRDVITDVATAANIDVKHVRVTTLRAGSVIVDMLIAKEAGDAHKIVRNLEEQRKSPTSPLLQGKVTSLCRRYYSVTPTPEAQQAQRAQAPQPDATRLVSSISKSPGGGGEGGKGGRPPTPPLSELKPAPYIGGGRPFEITLKRGLNSSRADGLCGIGLVIEKDLREDTTCVIAVAEGTAREHGQIRVGDTLYKIDGQSSAGLTTDQIEKLILGAPGSSITLTLGRK